MPCHCASSNGSCAASCDVWTGTANRRTPGSLALRSVHSLLPPRESRLRPLLLLPLLLRRCLPRRLRLLACLLAPPCLRPRLPAACTACARLLSAPACLPAPPARLPLLADLPLALCFRPLLPSRSTTRSRLAGLPEWRTCGWMMLAPAHAPRARGRVVWPWRDAGSATAGVGGTASRPWSSSASTGSESTHRSLSLSATPRSSGASGPRRGPSSSTPPRVASRRVRAVSWLRFATCGTSTTSSSATRRSLCR